MEMELKDMATEIIPARQKTMPRKVAASVPAEEPVQEVFDRKDLNYQWKKSKELVRGRFVNDETPGEAKEFVWRKFKQDPIRKWVLKDQGIYEIPLGLAQHLNENCKLPIYGWSKDEDGNPVEIITGYKKRLHFESLEFTTVGGFEDRDDFLPALGNKSQNSIARY